jgi:hypothetical protein
MPGFLDSKERIIDLVLTGVGRSLLSQGKLKFAYWIPYDDEIDYDPYVNTSASLTSAELETAKHNLTEDPLIVEAATGYALNNQQNRDKVNVNRPLYTLPRSSHVLPTMMIAGIDGGIDIEMEQKAYIRKYFYQGATGQSIEIPGSGQVSDVDRKNSTEANVEMSYSGSFGEGYTSDGFLITVYSSSSQGFVEISHKRDSQGSIAYKNDLKIVKRD